MGIAWGQPNNLVELLGDLMLFSGFRHQRLKIMSQAEVKKKKLRPANELIPDAQARRFFMASDAQVATARVEEMVSLLWHHTNASEQDVNVAKARVIEHFNSLAPCDGAEAMLAKQMVGTHLQHLNACAAPRPQTRRNLAASLH